MQQIAPHKYPDILAIQGEQLANWKLKLNAECYNALEAWATETNFNPETKDDPGLIRRGCQLSAFINDWRPEPRQNYWLATWRVDGFWDDQPQVCLTNATWEEAVKIAKLQDAPTRLSETIGFNNQGHYFQPGE